MGYIISLGVGFGVGLLYWLLKVQSPAPPLIALAGLLGMVLGEHAIPVVKAQFFAQGAATQIAVQAANAEMPEATLSANPSNAANTKGRS
jgi:XapX domain-containing protein